MEAKKESKRDEPKKDKEDAPKSKAVEKELPGGIKVLDSKVGTGPMAKKGNTVRMRYIGKLTTGKVFDKNVKGKPVHMHSVSLAIIILNIIPVHFPPWQGRSHQRYMNLSTTRTYSYHCD